MENLVVFLTGSAVVLEKSFSSSLELLTVVCMTIGFCRGLNEIVKCSGILHSINR